MRVIPVSDLPPDHHHLSVIHFGERDRYRRLATALERTLANCSEMRSEYESHTLILRENSQKEGFIAGFEMFINQLIEFINNYEKCQIEKLACFRSSILASIRDSFNDAVIVERIIHNLQVQCNQQKPLSIILPKTVKLSDNTENSNYIFSEDSNITIQNDMDSIRFPIDSVCQKWITDAEHDIYSLSQEMAALIPNILSEMLNQHSNNFSMNDDKIQETDK